MNSKFVFGQNIFDEREIHRVLADLSGKWVIHLKAEGLIKTPEKMDDFVEWYSDKISDFSLVNALINSEAKEVYVLLDTQQEVEDAYEDWFPNEQYLLDNESYLYVKFFAISPDGSVSFTNESFEAQS